ncbi:MAG TPA: hypothetical protein DCS45_00730 [Roseovarius nubinhibens]|uniref:Uncharacterized protein n=1 Tax=Roseovarius nubinhibens TaxID=314263 RepID=A0A348W773_9RHOB|nr:hypothetical protein [Roseovarius nubinhibens]
MVNLWPTRASLAEDICRLNPRLKVTTGQVHKWPETGSIPPRYHHTILIAARERGFEVTAELIVELHTPTSEDAA